MRATMHDAIVWFADLDRSDIAAAGGKGANLGELTRAGLIASRQDGRFIWYRADIQAMNTLIAYLTRNCCAGSAVCDPACAPAGAAVLASVAPESIGRAAPKPPGT